MDGGLTLTCQKKAVSQRKPIMSSDESKETHLKHRHRMRSDRLLPEPVHPQLRELAADTLMELACVSGLGGSCVLFLRGEKEGQKGERQREREGEGTDVDVEAAAEKRKATRQKKRVNGGKRGKKMQNESVPASSSTRKRTGTHSKALLLSSNSSG
jgi:hypothetical protein